VGYATFGRRNGDVLMLARKALAACLLAGPLLAFACRGEERTYVDESDSGSGSEPDGTLAADVSSGDDEVGDVGPAFKDAPGATDAADAADAADAKDAVDDGCALGTPMACGRCGNVCDTTTSTNAACEAGTCSYTCKSSRVDCDKATAPNTDGCECAGTGCCDSGCQTVHSDGLDGSYYHCAQLGAYSVDLALAACAAHQLSTGGDPSTCIAYACGLDSGAEVVCNTQLPVCSCWSYIGGGPVPLGRVRTQTDAACYCPFTGGDPQWN
jgi:hypothetical protein